MEDINLHDVMEAYRFGFTVTFDADKQIVKYGTTCNCCGGYFESETMEVYCEDCK